MKKVSEIISILNPKTIIGQEEFSVTSICYNSAKCSKNSLFVAIKGLSVDGHFFIDNAIDKGARVIVCEKLPEKIAKHCIYLVVDNSRKALALLSHFWYDNPSSMMKIHGITGTNGKTTITYILGAIFEQAGIPTGIIGTTGAFSNGFRKLLSNTTPESLDLAQIFFEFKNLSVKAVAMEVSSHSLDQERVLGISFNGAIFTNLTQDHLDYHSSLEEYAKAKKKLFDRLGQNSIAIVNSDDKFSHYIISDSGAKRNIFVGRNSYSDVQLLEEKSDFLGSQFKLRFNPPLFSTQIIDFKTNLVGKFNIENAAFSIVLAIEEGIPLDVIYQALVKMQSIPGRMQSIKLRNGALGIIDYAHTPDALEKILNSIREIILKTKKQNSSLICVFGCGGDRDKGKRPIMGKVASEVADYVIITSDNPRTEDPDKIMHQIYQGIEKEKRKKVILISNRDEAIRYAIDLSKADDIVVVAGKGHEDYQIIGQAKYHFSDLEQLQKYS